ALRIHVRIRGPPRRNPARRARSRKLGPAPARTWARVVRTLAKAQPKGREAWAKALPEQPAISLLCTLARPVPISAKARREPVRTSASAPEKARARSAKEAPRE